MSEIFRGTSELFGRTTKPPFAEYLPERREQTGNKALGNGITAMRHYDRYSIALALGGADRRWSLGNDHIDPVNYKLGGKLFKSVELTVSVSVFDHGVLAFNPA